jgi:hypothetical protein
VKFFLHGFHASGIASAAVFSGLDLQVADLGVQVGALGADTDHVLVVFGFLEHLELHEPSDYGGGPELLDLLFFVETIGLVLRFLDH